MIHHLKLMWREIKYNASKLELEVILKVTENGCRMHQRLTVMIFSLFYQRGVE